MAESKAQESHKDLANRGRFSVPEIQFSIRVAPLETGEIGPFLSQR